MFTGLIEAVGTLLGKAPLGGGLRLSVSHPAWEEGVELGASLAIDGCCLTVVEHDRRSFTTELTRETLARTRFAGLAEGSPLNLERPLAVGSRLGGHWVQGHVDGVLELRQIERSGETCYLGLKLPPHVRGWVVPQGSIALNGVSLTVLDVAPDWFRVAIVPHTWTNTNLSKVQPGGSVHVEYDILAKYVSAALRPAGGTEAAH